jgi:hypothetical protein
MTPAHGMYRHAIDEEPAIRNFVDQFGRCNECQLGGCDFGQRTCGFESHMRQTHRAPLAICLFAGVIFLAPKVSQAGLSFIGNSYVILNANLEGNQNYNTYYNVDNSSDNSNPHFTGNLGGLTIQDGQSLLLGGQTQTAPQMEGTSAQINYSIVGTDITGSLNLPYLQPNGNNDEWQSSPVTSVNLDQSLVNGTYTLDVWFSAENGNTVYDNNGGANYSATFQVVSEPVNFALGVFGVVFVGGSAGRFYLGRKIVSLAA